jgi:predicted phage terminase large subunit-like protein
LAPHLDFIDEVIVDAVAGRGPRFVVVECPPRHGKSELISHRTPAWYLGMFPERQVMLASYEASFAQTWGRKARDLLEEHGAGLYGVQVRSDARAADRWYTSAGGVMAASGIGGRFTGMGADLLIIDDPVKNAEEARSAVIRKKHIDWWQSTAATRLHPGAVVIVLMTRWHEGDLGGYLLSRGADEVEEPFIEVRLPAIAEGNDPLGRNVGDALWPGRYGLAQLEQTKRTVGSYWWSAMYQGRPVPEGGGMFKREWFPVLEVAPLDDAHKVRWVRFWDFAATEQQGTNDPDWAVGAKVGLTPAGRYVVADMQRVRATPYGVESLIRSTAVRDGKDVPVWLAQDPGAAGKIVVDHYVRTVLRGFAARGYRESGSKVVRADPVSAQAEAGNVSLVRGPWVEGFLWEAEQFPHGTHDDHIDALSGGFAVLSSAGGVRTESRLPSHTPPVRQAGNLTLVGEQFVDKA